ncbi:hypothetical protein CA606_18265 [Caulobacter vibrioides]|uniref:Uncharacterized protein n=1 Tax=Caulobacter vibrioides TaxID=155892 RepID=A0A290MQ50_CAUVI|nr:hypothetical protein [Caulobacter vibrioides]ATC34119.1 hypothetical protein CA606_18265 [Caulobacter vibrioides]
MTALTWNPALVDGPIAVPIYGPADPVTGERPVIGGRVGYHLNVARSAMPAGAAGYEVDPEPATPTRVFAGDWRGEDGRWALTALLLFPDEATAIAALPGLWSEAA